MLPNKIVSISESLIWKLPYILDVIKKDDVTVVNLCDRILNEFEDINEFILCLDALFILDKIYFDEKYEVIKYVD